MLTVENLHQSYGDKILFNSINCTISSHDRIGLIGVNGTGKSSLLRTIAGIDSPEKGSIHHPKDYQIEYLAQEPHLDDSLTVIEQIYFGDSLIMNTMRDYERALLRLQDDPNDENLQANLLQTQSKMDEHEAWEANTVAKVILTKIGINDFTKITNEMSGGH